MRWLRFVLKELTPDDIASTEEPHRLWKALWDEFPDIYAEVMLGADSAERTCRRSCGATSIP